jgi:hypothetical protein
LAEAAAASDAGEKLVRDRPVDAERQFKLALSKAQELTGWLVVVRKTLDSLDAGWGHVASAKALPGVEDWWAKWPTELSASVPDKLLEDGGVEGRADRSEVCIRTAEVA